MTTRPTDTPAWATTPSGGAIIAEPPTGKQIQGWLPGERPPSGSANWAWNRFASWVAHFAGAGSSFPTLEGAANAPAAAPLVVGDSCLINEPDGGTPGDVVVATMDATAAARDVRGIAAGGDGVVLAAFDPAGSNLRVRLMERGGTTLIREFTLTNTGAGEFAHAALYDGVDVIVSYFDGTLSYIESWDAATGATNWVVTSPVAGTSTPFDLAWDDAGVYVASNGALSQLVALNRATGATLWAFDHNGILRSVSTNGRLVFVQGSASGHATGATLRGVVASNGFDATGEGGLGTDAVLAWDQVQTLPLNTETGTLATDGSTLISTRGTVPGAIDLETRGCGDGVLVLSRLVPLEPTCIAMDQDYVFTGRSTTVLAYAKGVQALAWVATVVNPTLGNDLTVVSDGAAVFAGNSRIARGNSQPMRYRRVDPATEKWLPLRQLLIPVDRA